MKKWFFILAMVLICLLAACAEESTDSTTLPTNHTTATTNPDEPPRPEATEPALPANVGDILEVPDAAASFEEVTDNEIFRVEIVDAYDYRYIYAWEYSFATDTTVMYIYDEYENEEIINVIKRDVVTRYSRFIDEEEFLLNTETDEVTWLDDKQTFSNMMEALTQFSLPTEGLQYKKLEDVKATAGDACAYEVLDGDALTGYVYIDKATGIFSSWLEKSGTATTVITAISTEDAGIPDYK